MQRETLSSHDDAAGHLEVTLCYASAVLHILAHVYLFLLILYHNLGLYKSGTFLCFLDGNVYFFLERTIHSVEKKKTSFDLTDRTEGYEGQSSWKSRRYQFESVRFSMFTVPLITLAALLLTQKTSCELLAKEQDLVNHGIINKSHKEAMFSSTSLGNQRRLKEKDVVADFILMRRLDEHQVCRSLPIKISTKFIFCKRRYQFL